MAIAKSYLKRRLVLTRPKGVPANALKLDGIPLKLDGVFLLLS